MYKDGLQSSKSMLNRKYILNNFYTIKQYSQSAIYTTIQYLTGYLTWVVKTMSVCLATAIQ